MHLRLPLLSYPIILLFSAIMHTFLVLYLMEGTKIRRIPKEIQWFDLNEMKPIEIEKVHPVIIAPSLPKTKISSSPKKPVLDQKKKPKPLDKKRTNDALVKTEKDKELESVLNPTNSPFSFNEILFKTRNFQNQTPWINHTLEKPISSDLGSLLTGIIKIGIIKEPPQLKQVMRLDSKESKNYHNKLDEFFSEHWKVPLHLAESELTVVIRLKIDKKGTILSTQIEKPSGNKELDRSVEKLLKNLKSLPSLPYSYQRQNYEFGINFTPRDLQF